MDWIQAFTVIGVFATFFIYLLNRMDSNNKDLLSRLDTSNKDLLSRLDTSNKDLLSRIDLSNKELRAEMREFRTEMRELSSEVQDIGKRLATIEGCIMPRKVFHIERVNEDQTKEN